MGPLVPEVITEPMSLLMAVLLGIAFGFVLEQAGFSSSRKLTGLFYGTDFTVLRVFFTAGVTAMSGVLLLAQFGWLDTELIYINPTFLHSAILGGAIMGAGFVLGGYCPGTSFCGAAVGRIDAMAFAGGGLIGIFAFGEAFPWLQDLYKAGARGDLLISTALGIAPGQFAGVMIAIAVGAFLFTTRLEKKVNPQSGAYSFPVWKHRLAGAALLALAAVLFVMPGRQERLMAKASDPGYLRRNPVRLMAPDELAIRLMDRDPKIQLVDVREAQAFQKGSLPGAVNLRPAGLLGKEAQTALADARTLKVFFAGDEAGSIRAAALAKLAGRENVAALEGGFDRFTREIMNAENATNADRDTQAFRERAAREIAALSKELQRSAVPAKALRRVQGGCGG